MPNNRTASARARAKVTKNAAAVASIEEQRAKPRKTDLIAKAQALGIEGSLTRMNVGQLAAAIDLKEALAVTPQIETGANAKAIADELEAQSAEAELVDRPQPSEKVTRRNSTRSERSAATLDERKAHANHRGPGRKVTEEELLAYVMQVRKEHPESGRRTEQEYAYWVEKLAISRSRWDRAWDAAASRSLAEAKA